MNQELYIFKIRTIYLMVPKTQSTTTSFNISLSTIPKISIVLLVFINFQNIKSQSIFDNKLKELAITFFQTLILYFDTFKVLLKEDRFENAGQS